MRQVAQRALIVAAASFVSAQTCAPLLPADKSLDASGCAGVAALNSSCTVRCGPAFVGRPTTFTCVNAPAESSAVPVNSTWQGTYPACLPTCLANGHAPNSTCYDCLELRSAQNGVDTLKCPNSILGATCTVGCQLGFTPQESKFTCTIDHMSGMAGWVGVEPVCETASWVVPRTNQSWANKAWCPQTGGDDTCQEQPPMTFRHEQQHDQLVSVDSSVSYQDVAKLQSGGQYVICYMSGGTWEPYRDDAKEFPKALMGSSVSHWDETWLDIRSNEPHYPTLLSLMEERIKQLRAKGCQAIEFDNMDCWLNKCIPGVKAKDPQLGLEQLKYNRHLALVARTHGMAAGLKNDIPQIDDLIDSFDFGVNEACLEFDECDAYHRFTREQKAVLGVEYNFKSAKAICQNARENNWTLLTAHGDQWQECPKSQEGIDFMKDYSNVESASAGAGLTPARSTVVLATAGALLTSWMCVVVT